MSAKPQDKTPELKDHRARIAVDLGAESCRVSLLRWIDGQPAIQMVHRFANGPADSDNGLRWLLANIIEGVEDGLRRCAEIATEGVASVAVDGWAVDYVRLNSDGEPVEDPFCYRDERTVAAHSLLLESIPAQRLWELTGIQSMRINTLYQLCADRLAGLAPAALWLNLPEFLLHRWGGAAVAEFTNATHTQMVALADGAWSSEIQVAAGLPAEPFARIVPPGTRLGKMSGSLVALPAFAETELIAPACHDTASAIAGIPAQGDDWAYISSGTWSLVGTTASAPCTTPAAQEQGFMNLGGVGGRICFHTNVNGMWLLSQCRQAWKASGTDWEIEDLLTKAEAVPAPKDVLHVDAPDLLLIGNMPGRINAQLKKRGLMQMDESPEAAPAMVSLILHSLAARYAEVLGHVGEHIGKTLRRVFVVGGGSQNRLLSRLTAEATGLEVQAGPMESSTLGNFAVQLASATGTSGSRGEDFCADVSFWAALLWEHQAAKA